MADASLVKMLAPYPPKLVADQITLVYQQQVLLGGRYLLDVGIQVFASIEHRISCVHDLNQHMGSFHDPPQLLPYLDVLLEGCHLDLMLFFFDLRQTSPPIEKRLVLLRKEPGFGVLLGPAWLPRNPQVGQQAIPVHLQRLDFLLDFSRLFDALVHKLFLDVLHLEVAVCFEAFIAHLCFDKKLRQGVPLDNGLHPLCFFVLVIGLGLLEKHRQVIMGSPKVLLLDALNQSLPQRSALIFLGC